MRNCLSSFRIAGCIGSGLEKATCKRSLPVPRFSEDSALFYPFHYKTCACEQSIFIGTVPRFYRNRSNFFARVNGPSISLSSKLFLVLPKMSTFLFKLFSWELNETGTLFGIRRGVMNHSYKIGRIHESSRVTRIMNRVFFFTVTELLRALWLPGACHLLQ